MRDSLNAFFFINLRYIHVRIIMGYAMVMLKIIMLYGYKKINAIGKFLF